MTQSNGDLRVKMIRETEQFLEHYLAADHVAPKPDLPASDPSDAWQKLLAAVGAQSLVRRSARAVDFPLPLDACRPHGNDPAGWRAA